ncbi:hypothetical protein CSOJ01_03295 [Colletotrichum sojae]|uniref:Uncharacterized protein n=1 Tax=Colletotrichum sojae TaxID=2175907 RepID=A0A8H6JNF4_9PEZI|nr:hypothetical protein CSOJ01_03295 [Colletotrichum sojae]
MDAVRLRSFSSARLVEAKTRGKPPIIPAEPQRSAAQLHMPTGSHPFVSPNPDARQQHARLPGRRRRRMAGLLLRNRLPPRRGSGAPDLRDWAQSLARCCTPYFDCGTLLNSPIGECSRSEALKTERETNSLQVRRAIHTLSPVACAIPSCRKARDESCHRCHVEDATPDSRLQVRLRRIGNGHAYNRNMTAWSNLDPHRPVPQNIPDHPLINSPPADRYYIQAPYRVRVRVRVRSYSAWAGILVRRLFQSRASEHRSCAERLCGQHLYAAYQMLPTTTHSAGRFCVSVLDREGGIKRMLGAAAGRSRISLRQPAPPNAAVAFAMGLEAVLEARLWNSKALDGSNQVNGSVVGAGFASKH